MDKISIKNLEVFAHHGVFEDEKMTGQNFYLDCDCFLDTRAAGESDDLAEALDYGALAERLSRLFAWEDFDLIEAAAHYCAMNLLREYPLIRSLTLTVRKPSAPIDLSLDYPAVTITRGWTPVILALGSNLGFREGHLKHALNGLGDHPDIRLVKKSKWFETTPVGGPEGQGNFLNGAVLIETLLTPHALLAATQAIEINDGRERTIHWGPRTLDIDIIYYGDTLLADDTLTIPHPLCLERAFVMEPLLSIAPYWVDPRYGQAVSTLWHSDER